VKSSPSDKKPHRVHRPPDSSPAPASGLFHLYGRRPVLEALKLRRVRSLDVSVTARGPIIHELLQVAAGQSIPVSRVEAFPEEEGHHLQGIRALAEPPALRRDLRQFARRLPESPPPLLLMLDGIHDPHNFGAILRTADGAGVSAVVIRERRQAPVTDVVVKTSAGAAYTVPIFVVSNLSQTLRMLAEEGFWSVAAVAGPDAKPYREYQWNSKAVLIVGAEGSGVSDLLRRTADDRIAIPMRGRLESLNVSVATGILLFEAASHRFPST
jgi:23S rRNA (guanosine2251-2'-O)-methyltransferase